MIKKILSGGSTNDERGQAAYLRRKYMLRIRREKLVFLYFLNDILHHPYDTPYPRGVEITKELFSIMHLKLKQSQPFIGSDPKLQYISYEEAMASLPLVEGHLLMSTVLNEETYAGGELAPDWPRTSSSSLPLIYSYDGGATVKQRGQAAFLREKVYLVDTIPHLVALACLTSIVKRCSESVYPSEIYIDLRFLDHVFTMSRKKGIVGPTVEDSPKFELELLKFKQKTDGRRVVYLTDLLNEESYTMGGIFARDRGESLLRPSWRGHGLGISAPSTSSPSFVAEETVRVEDLEAKHVEEQTLREQGKLAGLDYASKFNSPKLVVYPTSSASSSSSSSSATSSSSSSSSALSSSPQPYFAPESSSLSSAETGEEPPPISEGRYANCPSVTIPSIVSLGTTFKNIELRVREGIVQQRMAWENWRQVPDLQHLSQYICEYNLSEKEIIANNEAFWRKKAEREERLKRIQQTQLAILLLQRRKEERLAKQKALSDASQ
jgi:hypothetical protein